MVLQDESFVHTEANAELTACASISCRNSHEKRILFTASCTRCFRFFFFVMDGNDVKDFRRERAKVHRLFLLSALGAAAALVAIVGCFSPTSSFASGTVDSPLEGLQQLLDSDDSDSVADSILQSARRKYAAMKRLEMKTRNPADKAVQSKPLGSKNPATHRSGVTSKVTDKKEIDSVFGGTTDHKTLVSRLEAAIANHKLSTRGLVEAVHEAQKVMSIGIVYAESLHV